MANLPDGDVKKDDEFTTGDYLPSNFRLCEVHYWVSTSRKREKFLCDVSKMFFCTPILFHIQICEWERFRPWIIEIIRFLSLPLLYRFRSSQEIKIAFYALQKHKNSVRDCHLKNEPGVRPGMARGASWGRCYYSLYWRNRFLPVHNKIFQSHKQAYFLQIFEIQNVCSSHIPATCLQVFQRRVQTRTL